MHKKWSFLLRISSVKMWPNPQFPDYQNNLVTIQQTITCPKSTIDLQLQVCISVKEETLAHIFSCKFCEIFKNIFSLIQLRWLLLCILHNLKSSKVKDDKVKYKYILNYKFLTDFKKITVRRLFLYGLTLKNRAVTCLVTRILRIPTGKKHPKIKLQRLRKKTNMDI